MSKVKEMALEEVVQLDLDANRITDARDLPLLPKELVEALKTSLDQIMKQDLQESSLLRSLRASFLQFHVRIFQDYRDYFIRPQDKEEVCFDVESFLKSHSRPYRKYLEAFTKSQMFEQWVRVREEWAMNGDDIPLDRFESMITKNKKLEEDRRLERAKAKSKSKGGVKKRQSKKVSGKRYDTGQQRNTWMGEIEREMDSMRISTSKPSVKQRRMRYHHDIELTPHLHFQTLHQLFDPAVKQESKAVTKPLPKPCDYPPNEDPLLSVQHPPQFDIDKEDDEDENDISKDLMREVVVKKEEEESFGTSVVEYVSSDTDSDDLDPLPSAQNHLLDLDLGESIPTLHEALIPMSYVFSPDTVLSTPSIQSLFDDIVPPGTHSDIFGQLGKG